MNKKRYLIAAAVACAIPFALSACNTTPSNDGNYGSLEDFYKDFFDDWDDVDIGNDSPIDDPSVLDSYESTTDYYDASVSKTYDPAYGTHIYEAEWAEFSSPQPDKPRRGKTYTASGGLVLNYMRDQAKTVFRINSSTDCTALFKMSVSVESGKFATTLFSVEYTPAGGETTSVPLDGVRIGGSGWDDYHENAIGELSLKAGENVITVESVANFFNFDYMLLVPKKDEVKSRPDGLTPTPPEEYENVYGTYALSDCVDGDGVTYDSRYGAHLYEGEKALLSGKDINVGNNANAHGGKVVERFRDGAHIIFAFDSERDGTALVKMGVTSNGQFATSSVNKLMKARFNGELVKNAAENFAGTKDWGNKPTENVVGEVRVRKGLNVFDVQTLGVAASNTVFNLDYITLLPKKSEVESVEIEPDEYVVEPEQWETVYGRYNKAEYVDGFNTVGGSDTVFDAGKGAHIYEAEKSALGEGLSVADVSGASGGKTIKGFGADKRTLVFEFKASADYVALLSVHSVGTDKKASECLEIKYNSRNLARVTDAKLASGAESYVAEIHLKKGDNKISLAIFGVGNDFAVDYITLSPRQADVSDDTPVFALNSGTTRIEAENCKLLNAKQDGEQAGITSGKVVGNTTPTSVVKFKVTAERDCVLELSMFAAYKDEDANRKVEGVDYSKLVNRLKIVAGPDVYNPQANLSFELPSGMSWWKNYKTHTLGNISLKAGENTITVYFLAGCMNIDYFEFATA